MTETNPTIERCDVCGSELRFVGHGPPDGRDEYDCPLCIARDERDAAVERAEALAAVVESLWHQRVANAPAEEYAPILAARDARVLREAIEPIQTKLRKSASVAYEHGYNRALDDAELVLRQLAAAKAGKEPNNGKA